MSNEQVWLERVLNVCESANDLTGDGHVEIAEIVESLKPIDFGISGRRVGALLTTLGLKERLRGSRGVKVYLSAEAIARARQSLKRLNGER